MKQQKKAPNEAIQRFVSKFDVFESQLDGGREMPFHAERRKALAHFSSLGFPTIRNEEWKYTSLKPILNVDFQLANGPKSPPGKATMQAFTFDEIDCHRLIFVNGRFWGEETGQDQPDGVEIRPMREALAGRSEAIDRHFAKHISYADDAFVSLNTAFASDGVLVRIPADVDLNHAIHIVNIADPGDFPMQQHPRNLIVCGDNSRAQIIETFHAVSDQAVLNNSVTEVVVGANADVAHIRIQNEGPASYHIASRQVVQDRASTYTSITVDLGCAIARNNLSILHQDQHCESNLYGFFMGIDRQLIDNHTFIDHARPNCESNELYKGILDDKARGVFNGKIMVRQAAQKTNAFQSNKALLLSDDASMNAKPQLEIFADDVKCSHGATIGQLDEEALFYLQARGISAEKAHAMLQFAFAGDVLDKIEATPIRLQLNRMINSKFKFTFSGD